MSISQDYTHKEPLKAWSLAKELYRSFHQWPVILLFMGVGALVGWSLTFMLPANYRAVEQVYVGLNPYRAFSDANFLAVARPKYSNIDDYKNWQMSQLETVIYLDTFMDATLDRLRKQDPYWDNMDANQLFNILEADWRTAGVWSLIATHPDPLPRATSSQRLERGSDSYGGASNPRFTRILYGGSATAIQFRRHLASQFSD